MCGGLSSLAGDSEVPDGYDFLEWHREGLVLLTNLSTERLPLKKVSVDRLPGIPLVIPSGGVISDFLRRWYGVGYHERLTIAASIDDIYYGLALLRSRMTDGCMIVSREIGRAATDGRLPGSPGFRLVEFGDDFNPMLELVTGVFARKGERHQYEPTHPLNCLWNAFEDETRSGTAVTL